LLSAASKKGVNHLAGLISVSLSPSKLGAPIRIHVSGDFFNQNYFDAWIEVAKRYPTRLFYAYTKALPFWVKRIHNIPQNLVLTASYGGTHDFLIKKHNLRSATVVESVEEAKKLRLKIDHDDSLAMEKGKSFALLVHGSQPAGTTWAKAWHRLKKLGMGGYGLHRSKTVTAGAKSISTVGVPSH